MALWKGGAFAARLQAAVSDRRDDARRWSAEPGGGSGNSAFDEYRAATLRRLEEERLALDAQQREFAEFLQQLKRARDREEFDRFMAAGRGRGADA